MYQHARGEALERGGVRVSVHDATPDIHMVMDLGAVWNAMERLWTSQYWIHINSAFEQTRPSRPEDDLHRARRPIVTPSGGF